MVPFVKLVVPIKRYRVDMDENATAYPAIVAVVVGLSTSIDAGRV